MERHWRIYSRRERRGGGDREGEGERERESEMLDVRVNGSLGDLAQTSFQMASALPLFNCYGARDPKQGLCS